MRFFSKVTWEQGLCENFTIINFQPYHVLVGAFLVKPFYRRQVWCMVEKNLFISHVHAVYWWQNTGYTWDQDLTAWSLELEFSWECPAYQFKSKDCLFEAQETHKLICEWTGASSSVCLVRKLNGKTSGSELYEIPWISESVSWLRLTIVSLWSCCKCQINV